MKTYRYFFFDLDKTITPSRQPMLPEMYDLLKNTDKTIIIVSGSIQSQIAYQSNDFPAIRLAQNGNDAIDIDGTPLWNVPLSDEHRTEILDHISEVMEILDHEVNHDWNPIEDRGAQITFSPIGNTAPIEHKKLYDPDGMKRESLLRQIPFASEDLVVLIGGSTSLDYIHRERHKGANVQKIIDLKGWQNDDCVYFGDGLKPGGNDESVIGVIDTVYVTDHLDTYAKLQAML